MVLSFLNYSGQSNVRSESILGFVLAFWLRIDFGADTSRVCRHKDMPDPTYLIQPRTAGGHAVRALAPGSQLACHPGLLQGVSARSGRPRSDHAGDRSPRSGHGIRRKESTRRADPNPRTLASATRPQAFSQAAQLDLSQYSLKSYYRVWRLFSKMPLRGENSFPTLTE